MLLDKNWKSFFEALKAYEEDPSKFLGRPKLPKYKHKTEGRNILVYTIQFSGKRIGRRNRLYRTKDGRTICADVNGAYNILCKSKPDAFAKGTAAYVVQPLRLTV